MKHYIDRWPLDIPFHTWERELPSPFEHFRAKFTRYRYTLYLTTNFHLRPLFFLLFFWNQYLKNLKVLNKKHLLQQL